MSADSIRLVIPRERRFHGVARLVVGGLAARLNASYERLEDLQLALSSVLDRGDGGESDLTIELTVDEEWVEVLLGPFENASLADALEENGGGGIGLRRLLETLVERVELSRTGDSEWIRLTKELP